MDPSFKRHFFSLALGLSFMLTSCSGLKDIPTTLIHEKSSCYHQTDYHYTLDEIPEPVHDIEIDTLLTNRLSFESLNVANAIGLLDLLTKYLVLRYDYSKQPTLVKRIELLEVSQTINQKINTSSLEISSVASELDCEEERASQYSNYLKGKVEEREKNLVIGSIIIGAAGAITAEILSNQETTGKSGSYVAIGTSLVEATLGVLMLVNNRKIPFSHVRNTPGEIWKALPISSTLPPSIWYYLNYENPKMNGKSLRRQLVENWVNFGLIESFQNKNGTITDDIYFGKGGKYTSEQLKNRADMYDQIESYVSLMKQDLKLLSIELENIADTILTAPNKR